MNVGKFLLYGGLGIAAVLLLTTGKAKDVRDKVQDEAIKNAKKWKDRLSKASADVLNKVRHDGQIANVLS